MTSSYQRIFDDDLAVYLCVSLPLIE